MQSLKRLVRPLLPAQAQLFAREYRSRKLLRSNKETRVYVDTRFEFPRESNGAHIDRILGWIVVALNANGDGGIPASVDLRKYAQAGHVTFASSFPETTGYLLATLVLGHRFDKPSLSLAQLEQIVNYLCRVQLPCGGYPGADGNKERPLAFDTGQVLTGLVSYHRHVAQRADVLAAITRAAEWMGSEIGSDGGYSASASHNGRRSYYIRSTMGLAVAARLLERQDLLSKAEANLEWTVRQRCSRYWLNSFSFEDGKWQNLHGVAYTIQGLIEVGTMLKRPDAVELGRLLLDRIREQHFDLLHADCIPGYFSRDFAGYRKILSPTGICQIACSSFKLSAVCAEPAYFAYGRRLIETTKRFHTVGFGDAGANGLLPGSWPVFGHYEHCSLPNWPIKFFLDGLYVLEGASALALEN